MAQPPPGMAVLPLIAVGDSVGAITRTAVPVPDAGGAYVTVMLPLCVAKTRKYCGPAAPSVMVPPIELDSHVFVAGLISTPLTTVRPISVPSGTRLFALSLMPLNVTCTAGPLCAAV